MISPCWFTVIASQFLSSTTVAFTPLAVSHNNIYQMTSSSFSESSTTQHPCAVVANPPCTKDAKAVIFDIDGTLANSWRLGYDATVVVLQKNDLGHVPINEEIYHQTCVYPTPERLARTAGLQPGDDNFEEMGETLGAQFDEYYVQLVSLATCEFYDGIASMLSNLPSTVQLGALTNACVAYGYAVLKVNTDETSNSLKYDRFGSIHGADSVPAAKPNPDGLLVSAKELNVEPKDCIYVGDAIGDGKAARAAGMMSIGVTWGSNSEDKLRDAQVFDYICRTRDELQELLPQASTNNES